MWKTVFASAGLGVSLIAISGSANDNSSISTNRIEIRKADEIFKNASLLFQQGHAEEAQTLLQRNEDLLQEESLLGKELIDLYIDINLSLTDRFELLEIYERFPHSFATREDASLILADAFILQKDGKQFYDLRKKWEGKESRKAEWLLLDVDASLLNNNRQQAIKYLESGSLEGDFEVNRLVRLALLFIQDNPKAAWEYLSVANDKDPDNIDIYIYRARLLESVDKKKLAFDELQKALEIAPDNIFLKDLIGDFYLRNGHYHEAMAIWLDSFDGPILDTVLLKALFWNRMITPVKYDWNSVVPPTGKLHSLNSYLLELPLGQYWDVNSFQKSPNYKSILSNQQAAYWLRLVDALKANNEDVALQLMESNPFIKESWDPSLERVLRQLLVYHSISRFANAEESEKWDFSNNQEKFATGENAFFDYLNQVIANPNLLEEDKEFKNLLNSKEAFVVAFLSSGWLEAGLSLLNDKSLSNGLPDWVSIAVVEAIQTNRGTEEALKFAAQQPLTHPLSNFISDVVKTTKISHKFQNTLKNMASQPSEKGARAAWLLSLINLEKGDYQAAKEVILSQSLLANVQLGKETLARIALLEGDSDEADRLYSQLEMQSIEAKSYLARKAFIEGNWEKARSLTEQLLRVYPDSELLKDNLKKIAFEARLQK